MNIRIVSNALQGLAAAGIAAAITLILPAWPSLAQQSQAAPVGQFGPRVQPPAGGQPQGGQPRMPPPEIIGTFNDWKVQCETTPAEPETGMQSQQGQEPAAKGTAQQANQSAGAANNQPLVRQCGVIQTAINDKNKKVGVTLIIVKGKQGDKTVTMMRVMAPIGVFLPTGIAMEVDGAAIGRMPFTRCVPQLCMAFAEATNETLGKMKKGKAANFIIYEAPGLGLTVKITLQGFKAAMDALDKQI